MNGIHARRAKKEEEIKRYKGGGMSAESFLKRLQVGLLLHFDLHQLSALFHHVLVLDAHDALTELSAQSLVVVVLLLEVLYEVVQISEVLVAHLSEGNARSRLLVHQAAQTRLALDEAERHLHALAESRKVNHELNRVHVVSDSDQLGLLRLHEGRDMVQPKLNNLSLLASLASVALSLLVSLCSESHLLLLLSLRRVFLEELEELVCY